MRQTLGLVAALADATIIGTLPPAVDAIVSDSRDVRGGTLFVATRGTRSDGHAFIADAVGRGAALIVAETASDVSVPQIIVPDSRDALSALSDAFYERPSQALVVIGVTGTNGKTTTTHLIHDVLEAGGIACGVIGTLGGSFRDRTWPLGHTTPLAPQLHALLAEMLAAGAQAVAMEVSSHALALGRVAHVRFAVAVLTNVTRDHLDFHGTFERYAAAKRHLLELAPLRIVNSDDAVGAACAAEMSDVTTYALDRDATLRPIDLHVQGDGSTFELDGTHVSIGLPGRFNVRNALAAFGVGRAMHIDDTRIAAGLANTRAVPGRMERFGAFGIEAIVDYAHTPDALENVLTAVRETTRRQVILVFGCGGDRDAGKRAQMGAVGARLADRVIVTTDNPRSEDPLAIAESIARNFEHTEIVLDRRTAIRRAIDQAQAGDTVVVAGKGHEAYQIVGDDVHPFDDREEVRFAFSKRAQAQR